MMLKIGEFSRRGRVSVKALRHYESVGLLRPAHVDGATGYRYYEPRQLDELHRLMVLRALGLSLDRIRDLLQDEPSPGLMRQLLAERRAALAHKLEAEQAQLAAIEARIRHIESREPSYEVVLRDIPSVFVASLRRVVPDYGAVESLFDEITHTLPGQARITGHGALWHHCAPHKQEIDCEALVLLERPVPTRRSLKVYRLPACRAACVVHPSDEDAFAPACAAAHAAVARQPFEIDGPMRERYFSSAGNARFDLTEIQFPLRTAQGAPT